jgi:hypothetical protein
VKTFRGRQILIGFLLTVQIASAQGTKIREFYEGLLNLPSDAQVPSQKTLLSVVNETAVMSLSDDDVNSLLPLGRRALQSSRPDVRRDGLFLFGAISIRPNSSGLLKSYLADIELIASNSSDPLRMPALYTLGSTNPDPLPEAISYFSAHLADKANSPREIRIMTTFVIQSAGKDNNSGLIHQTLVFLDSHPDAVPGRIGALEQLGLAKTRNTEALAFIGKSLDSDNQFVREASVEAVDRLDPDIRANYSDQLNRIATDPKESERARTAAKAVLAK